MQTRYSDSTLTVDLSAIADNYRLLKKQLKNAECACVVKSNAYGLGVEEVAKTLLRAGAGKFFVATIDEAVNLRQILQSKDIYIFHGFLKGQESALIENRLVPVLNSIEQVINWADYSKKTNLKMPCIIHIDTGMNRLGLSNNELDEFIEKNLQDYLDIKYIMSHLACADVKDHPLNKKQLDEISRISKCFSGIPISFSNSFGVFLGKNYHFDLARPGMALYGLNPTPDRENPMKTTAFLSSKIIQIREIDTPSCVGYGATCELPAGARVATLPVGYADGYLRSLGNSAFCYFKKHKLPVVGRVSMDLIMVDISNVPNGQINVGDEIEIMGKNISADDLAKTAGTIGYEILTRLGARYKRFYK